MMLQIAISRRRITRVLATIVTGLAGVSVVAQSVKYRTTSPDIAAFARIFKLSAEETIPAYFSALLLIGSAGLFWAISRGAAASGERFVRHWGGLAMIFAYMSIDEAVGIHELAIDPMRRMLGHHAAGVLHFAWVVPGAAAVMIVGLAYLRLVLQLPARVRNRLFLAAVLYVGGALGLEMVAGIIAGMHGTSNVAYALVAWLEECGEMFGVVVLIDALLLQLATYGTIRAKVVEGHGARQDGGATGAVGREGSEAGEDGSPPGRRGITRSPYLVRDTTWNGARSNPTSPQR